MLLRAAFVAAMLLAGSAAQALPLDQFTLPNNDVTQQKKKDSSDGLFNHSIPDSWSNSSGSKSDGSDIGKVHFSVTQNNYPAPTSNYGDAKTPMSEFYGPTPPQNDNTDPLLAH